MHHADMGMGDEADRLNEQHRLERDSKADERRRQQDELDAWMTGVRFNAIEFATEAAALGFEPPARKGAGSYWDLYVPHHDQGYGESNSYVAVRVGRQGEISFGPVGLPPYGPPMPSSYECVDVSEVRAVFVTALARLKASVDTRG